MRGRTSAVTHQTLEKERSGDSPGKVGKNEPNIFPHWLIRHGPENSQGGKESQIVGRPYQQSETAALRNFSPKPLGVFATGCRGWDEQRIVFDERLR